jgi:hypothetical protein
MWYLVLSHSLPDQKERKQLHLTEHGNGWRISTGRDESSFPGRHPIDRMEFMSCWLRASAALKNLRLKTPITLKASAPWKSWNGTPPRVPL